MKVTKRASHGIRFLVLFVALALVATAVPLAVFFSAPTARAMNVTTWDSLKSNIERTGSGSSLEVTIPNGTNISVAIGNSINVPSGANITVINNGSLAVTQSGGNWYNVDGNIFNVSSGAALTLRGSGTYRTQLDRTGMEVTRRHVEVATARLTLVRNSGGTVNLEAGNYVLSNKLEYNSVAGSPRYGSGSVFIWSAVVWNQNDTSTVNIKGGAMDIDAFAAGDSSSDDEYGQMNDNYEAGIRLFNYAYGVYGGAVNMYGGSMDMLTSSWYKDDTGWLNDTSRAYVAGTIAYGIMSENVHMVNGNINVRSKHGATNEDTVGRQEEWTLRGAMSSWAAGIAYKDNPPVVDGGSIQTVINKDTEGNTANFQAWDRSDIFSRKNMAIMDTPSAASVSYDPARFTGIGYHDSEREQYPLEQVKTEHRWRASEMWQVRNSQYTSVIGEFSGEPTAGMAYDSNGRTSFTGSGANMAKGQNNSATGAKNMYIFRYYDENGNLDKWTYQPDTAIAAPGEVHYVWDTPVTNTGSGDMYYKAGYKPRSYSDTAYVDLEALVNSGANGMTVTDRFTYPGAEHTLTHANTVHFYPRTAGSYIYVFIDYYKNAPEALRMSSTGGSVPYDGEPITAADFGLAIYGTRNTETTGDDDNITSMVSPAYSYTGTSPSGKELSGSGLPQDAGDYTITVNIPANSATNRQALEGKASVKITAVNPGFVDGSIEVDYPTSLGEILFDGNIVKPAQAAFADDFTYEWTAGGETVPPVTAGGTNYTVRYTVKEEAKDNYLTSYHSGSFGINVTARAQEVTLSFGTATVVYGDDFPIENYITVQNNAGGTLTGDDKAAVMDAIRNQIKIRDAANNETTYAAGTTTAGIYTWGFAGSSPMNLGNYTISAGEWAALEVTKAPLTITVSTAEATFPYRAEFDELYGYVTISGETVSIAAKDVAGIKGNDRFNVEIGVSDVWVDYPNDGNVGVGTLQVDQSAMTLTGSRADCYYIASATGAKVTITQAELPSEIQKPELEAQVYDPMRTLEDLYRENQAAFLEHLLGGHYEPKDPSIVPSVNVPTYTFIYYPNNTNYKQTEVDIPITVTRREITVSAAPITLEYGSELSQSEYEWTFSGWTEDASAIPGESFPVLVSGSGGFMEESGGSLGMSGATFANRMTLTSTYSPTTNAGTPVAITVNGTFDLSADNYSFVFQSGTVTVTKRQLDVIAPDATAAFGETPAADASKVIYGSDEHGFVNDETVSSVFGASNPVSFVYGSGIYGTASWDPYEPGSDPAGEYRIYPVFVNDELTNYTINAIPGTLTVEKRVITIVAQDMTITYGEEAPSEAVFVATDPSIDLSDVFSGAIAITTNYEKGDNAGGSYTIQAVCNEDGTYTPEQQPDISLKANYEIVFGEPAVLTVEKANLPKETVQLRVPHPTFTYSDSITLQEQLRNQNLESATITLSDGTEVTGTFTYDRGTAVPHVSESGDFAISFVPTGDSAINYNDLAGLQSAVRIEKAPVTGSLQLGGQMMAGGLVYPITSGLKPSGLDNYTYTWYVIDADGTETKVDTEFNRRLELTAEHEGKKIKLVESPIAYDGKTHGITAEVVVPAGSAAYTGELTVKYNGETELPKDAGTYYITVDCASDGTYASATALSVGTLVIQPAELTLRFAVSDKIYDATTNAALTEDSIEIVSGLIDSDAQSVVLNTRNARAVFADANAGEDKTVELQNVYLSGDRASNYVIGDAFATASIAKKTVNATARLQQYAVDYSPALADENTSGVSVYFANITSVMSRDRAGFSIAADQVAILNPRGGETCEVDMSTIQAVPNNDNYVVEVTNAEALTILVNQITPECAADLTAAELTMDSRVYDSKGNLTNEELRAFIATLDGGKYADQAQYYSWALVDGATPVPQVSTTATPRAYDVVFDNGDSNYREVTFKVRVPVTKREVVIQAASFTVPYGSVSPLAGDAETYTVLSGLYEDETLLSVFRAEPSVRSSYLQYEDVGEYAVTVNTANLRNNNYTITVRPGTIRVTTVNLTAEAVATDKPYDGSDQIMITFTDLVGKVRPNDDVYLPAFVYGTVSDPNAGSNKLVLLDVPALEGSAAGNYTLTITNRNRVTVDITKLIPTEYSFPTRATVVYGEPLSTAVTDGTERGDGEFFFELANEVPANVGVYTSVYDMIFQPYDSNYESVRQKVTLEVTVAYLTIEPVITGSVDVGTMLTVSVPGIPNNALNYIHYRWYRVGSDGSQVAIGTDSATYTTVAADVGYTIRVDVSFGEGDPYQGEGSVTTLPIEEEKLSFWERIWKWFYQLFEAIRRLFSIG